MLNINDIMETINMISEENLDIRTVTMGISLLDCADSDIKSSCDKIYEKITRLAGNLVKTGDNKQANFRNPHINACRHRRRPRAFCQNVAARGGHYGRKLYRRLLRPCA